MAFSFKNIKNKIESVTDQAVYYGTIPLLFALGYWSFRKMSMELPPMQA